MRASSSLVACLIVSLASACQGIILTGAGESDDPNAPGGGDALGDAGVVDDGDASTVAPPGQTSVRVTLHPVHPDQVGPDTLVAFGAPFPRGQLLDIADLVVANAGGTELASHVELLVPWRSMDPSNPPASVRSALVYVIVDLSSGEPVEIELRTGAQRTLELGSQPPVTSTWVDVTPGDYPITVREPAVFATFPPQWLGEAELRSTTRPVDVDGSLGAFDEFFVGASHTAVNDVPDTVTDRIDVTTNYAPWLFDRASTLFTAYVRTGDVRWLQDAHRAVQFYVAHLNAAGYFDLKGDNDLKYSYGLSPLIDLMLVGDRSLVGAIERIASAGEEWNPTYVAGRNFWTERHQTYALMAALTAWEATGDAAHATRVQEVIDASFSMATSPVSGWTPNGCMLHSFLAHEGYGSTDPICSPWMSALFAEAVHRYYRHSGDEDALRFLAGLADYVDSVGLYDGSVDNLPYRVPWYLASSVMTNTDSGPWADVEHTCDVAGMVARGAWAKQELGQPAGDVTATASELIDACLWNLDYWYRPNTATLAAYRLTPPRKYNWWFGTTSDLPQLWSQIAP